VAEVTIKIPEAIKDIVEGMGETIYVEALKELASKRISQSKIRLKELKKEITAYESKYGKSYEEFSQSVTDTMEGHDDWIEWSYLVKVSEELSDKIQKLKLLTGE